MSGDATRAPRSRAAAGDDRAVRVAEHDVGAHRDELVGEDQAVLEHPLVDQHRALALGREGDGDRGQVGRERGPGAVLDLALELADVARDASSWPPGTMTSRAVELGVAGRGGAKTRRIMRRSSGTVSLMRISPPGHAGQGHERADLDVVGRDGVVAAAEAVLAPSTVITFEPMPSIAAPIATSMRARSWTWGSQAALPIDRRRPGSARRPSARSRCHDRRLVHEELGRREARRAR